MRVLLVVVVCAAGVLLPSRAQIAGPPGDLDPDILGLFSSSSSRPFETRPPFSSVGHSTGRPPFSTWRPNVFTGRPNVFTGRPIGTRPPPHQIDPGFGGGEGSTFVSRPSGSSNFNLPPSTRYPPNRGTDDHPIRISPLGPPNRGADDHPIRISPLGPPGPPGISSSSDEDDSFFAPPLNGNEPLGRPSRAATTPKPETSFTSKSPASTTPSLGTTTRRSVSTTRRPASTTRRPASTTRRPASTTRRLEQTTTPRVQVTGSTSTDRIPTRPPPRPVRQAPVHEYYTLTPVAPSQSTIRSTNGATSTQGGSIFSSTPVSTSSRRPIDIFTWEPTNPTPRRPFRQAPIREYYTLTPVAPSHSTIRSTNNGAFTQGGSSFSSTPASVSTSRRPDNFVTFTSTQRSSTFNPVSTSRPTFIDLERTDPPRRPFRQAPLQGSSSTSTLTPVTSTFNPISTSRHTSYPTHLPPTIHPPTPRRPFRQAPLQGSTPSTTLTPISTSRHTSYPTHLPPTIHPPPEWSIATSRPTRQAPLTPCETPGSRLPFPGECTLYFECDDRGRLQVNQCAHTTFYNWRTTKCETGINVCDDRPSTDSHRSTSPPPRPQ